nr:unnamed protein product [Spirometra erinaceieuropaei]
MNFTFSVCCLNQWALDFAGNSRRIRQSILKAKQEGSRYRLGPELELSGYGCEDHFHETDTYAHSWECLAEILKSTAQDDAYRDIVCDIGMPVLFENVRFNCRLVILNGRILLIRPKTVLADGGLHREPRWFTAWNHAEKLRQYPLPEIITSATPLRQTSAPFGCPLLRFSTPSSDSLLLVGLETCEELWVSINNAVEAFLSATLQGLNESGRPLFENEGGTPTEDLALQNLQARSRLVLSYLTAQLLPWSKKHTAFNSSSSSSSSSIARPPLVLSSANLDECLCGYLTK